MSGKMFHFSALLILVLFAVSLAGTANATTTFTKEESKWVQQLDSKDTQDRMDAIQELVELKCVKAKDKLVTMMQEDEAYQNRITAAKALLDLGLNDTADVVSSQAEREQNRLAKRTLTVIANKMKENS